MGKVIHKIFRRRPAVRRITWGSRNDRKYLWAGGLDDSKIYVFDVGHQPVSSENSSRRSTISRRKTGYAGPHTYYALPGRMLIGNLSNVADKGRRQPAWRSYNNKGGFVAKYDMPASTIKQIKGDGYGYDIAVNPAKKRPTGPRVSPAWNNFMARSRRGSSRTPRR